MVQELHKLTVGVIEVAPRNTVLTKPAINGDQGPGENYFETYEVADELRGCIVLAGKHKRKDDTSATTIS